MMEYAKHGEEMVAMIGGQEIFAGFLLFIVGLTSFKYNLELTQFLNISRKKFFMANILALVVIALCMTIIEKSIGVVVDKLTLIDYHSAFNIFYADYSFVSSFLWLLSYFITASSFGWLVGMLYYRSNRIVRVLIWISPVIVVNVFLRLVRYYNINTGDLVERLFGFSGDRSGNQYVAVLTAVVFVAVCLALNYLTIRRTVIKSGA